MNTEHARATLDTFYELLDADPVDRLDCLTKALHIQQVILRCMVFLDNLKGSPYIEEYTLEDLSLVHESFCDSAMPLLHMLEHFLARAEVVSRENPFAV